MYQKEITEQTAIFLSITKWVFLAVIIGILVGLSTALFLRLLTLTTQFSARYPYYYLALPGVFVFCSWLINWLAPQSKGHGTEKVIEAVHQRSGRIKLAVVPVKLFTTLLTLGAGGSVGKEGPSGQIGAALASGFADLFRLTDADRRKLVICGISAGFAGVFGTPISGAIFGLEVLYVGSLMYDVMLPSFISGIVAWQVCTGLGVEYFHSHLRFVPAFSQSFFAIVLGTGIVFGSLSFGLIEAFRVTEKWLHNWRTNEYLKNAAGGLVLVALVLALGSTRYLGLGTGLLEGVLDGHITVNWYDFLFKILFTVVTLSVGGSGGIVTPIFFIGTTAGALLGHLLGLDVPTFAAIGMVSLLSGAANTPIAASIMGLELFGPALAPYAAVACVISFLMTGHRSVYPSQILAVNKSAMLDVPMGQLMQDVGADLSPRERRRLRRLQMRGQRLFRRERPRPDDDPAGEE